MTYLLSGWRVLGFGMTYVLIGWRVIAASIRIGGVLFSGGRVAGAAVAKLAYAVGLKSTGVFPVVGSSPTSRTIFYLPSE